MNSKQPETPLLEAEEKQPIKFQLYENTLIWKINKKQMCERSTLLKGLFESCKEFSYDQPIQLKLEKPDKFITLLNFLETGKIPKEVKNFSTVSDYVNDIIYLGIDLLEACAINCFQRAIWQKQCSAINLSETHVSFDFIERVLRETQGGCNYERCKLLMSWMGKNNIDRRQLEALTQFIKFDRLKRNQIKKLLEKFPDSFDYIMKPSILLTIKCAWRCVRCNQVNDEEQTICVYCHRIRKFELKL